MTDNPYEVLQLGPDAGEAEAVRQASLLCQRAADEPARNRIRQAVQRLTASPDARLLWSLLTHPGSAEASPELDRFVNAHRRPPAVAGEIPVPGVDADEFRALACQLLAAEFELAPPELERLPAAESEAEILRQTAEVVWQSLLVDSRA